MGKLNQMDSSIRECSARACLAGWLILLSFVQSASHIAAADAPQKPDVSEAKIREVFTDVSGEKFSHIYVGEPFTVRGSFAFTGEDLTNEPTKVMVELARKAEGHTICWWEWTEAKPQEKLKFTYETVSKTKDDFKPGQYLLRIVIEGKYVVIKPVEVKPKRNILQSAVLQDTADSAR